MLVLDSTNAYIVTAFQNCALKRKQTGVKAPAASYSSDFIGGLEAGEVFYQRNRNDRWQILQFSC